MKRLPSNQAYGVTASGQVFSYKRGIFLKQSDNGRGYKFVNIPINRKQRSRYVHRLVAETFLPNPHNLKEVNHINGDAADNRLANLEWLSPLDNINDSLKRRGHETIELLRSHGQERFNELVIAGVPVDAALYAI